MTNSIISHSRLLWAILLLLAACSPEADPEFFQTALSLKPDTLLVDGAKDTLVYGPKGTGLFFEKESFEMPDGSKPKGKISIQIKECYSLADILRENLSTRSDGRLLETRGMVNVQAFSGNQELRLRKGKNFIIHFPKDAADKENPMNLFYGNNADNQGINWKLDNMSILRPTAFMNGMSLPNYGIEDELLDESSYYDFQDKKLGDLYNYFRKYFDYTKLKSVNIDSSYKWYEAEFIVDKRGKLRNIQITEKMEDTNGRYTPIKNIPDPYLYTFLEQLPSFMPFRSSVNKKSEPVEVECLFLFSLGTSPPTYKNNEAYSRIFNQKYSAFKNSNIRSMNDAELDNYIFSASKLGWINCDFFWETKDEKIDYLVKVDPKTKPNIKLVFKDAKSIMDGNLDEDRYVFKDVPINQDIKIVAIRFEGGKPLLSVSLAKTGKQIFDKLDYKEFTLDDLERQIDLP